MGFSEVLIARAKPIWDKFLTHPFITQLTDGTLEREKFLRYLVQDTLYLKYFSKVYAYAFIKAEDIEVMRRIYKDLRVIVADESFMHIRYLLDMGSSEVEALRTPLAPECQSYIDFMMKTAAEGSAAEGLVSLMPCTLSYNYIARYACERARANGTFEQNYYKAWMLDYISESYTATYESTVALCDLVCDALCDAEKEKLIQIFLRSSEYELDFWNMGSR